VTTTSSCSCGTNFNVYFKNDGTSGIYGKFYKTQLNCENNINDWNNFSLYYLYNGERYFLDANGQITDILGCN